jgi:hypothetical protein
VKRSLPIDFAFNHHAVIEVRERDRRERRYQARTTPKVSVETRQRAMLLRSITVNPKFLVSSPTTVVSPNEKCSDVFTRPHGLRKGAKSGGESVIAFCPIAGADSRCEGHLENVGCVVEEVQHVLSERTRARDGGNGFI